MVIRNPHLDERRRREVYGGADPRERFIAKSNRRRYSPTSDYGDRTGGGEFQGWRSKETSPVYKENYFDYPANEFSGITSPNLLAGKKSNAYGDTLIYKDLMDKWLGMDEDNPYQGSLTKSQRGERLANQADSEGFEPILGNWMTRQNPYFKEKQWNPDDLDLGTYPIDYTSEPERPSWDNWFGNLIRQLGGQNRGGLASLRYAR